ncbi:SWIM zinc finger family protein [Kineosporia sp. J2-2]|uniref:SWIM zinc finger family protein n=1 Tax=Kineosporia corallincola TaxID=2835133 RepID=A0ABS5TE76_9ACTN|nr:SWIM zinc finger family protein [Kineosporia corallincola]MBT0769366.1 SWIM zinc finger family protein [Kineosporia corallincola]
MADFSRYGRPLPVENGLSARSTRGGIGEQWWSRRFIGVLESFVLGTRLTRGRAYARKGQVISIEVEAGTVSAEVQGSRVTPYRVRIGLKKFSELVWAKVEVALAEQALFSAQLLAGEFPRELEPVLAGIGAPLFPGRLADLDLRCTCPDQAVPCKHIAAVFYLLAERFDDDPFLLLRWRGRAREALLDRLRALRGDADLPGPSMTDDEEPADPPAPGRLSAALALREAVAEPVVSVRKRAKPGPPGGDAVAFWTAGPLLPLPSHAELPPDLLLRQLPTPGPALGGAGLIGDLRELYGELAEGD